MGLGYVGLSTAVCFASRGIECLGVDTDEKKIESLKRGKVPFVEPGLPESLRKAVDDEKLTFRSDYRGILSSARVVFMTVGTPSRRGGSIDLSQVKAASISLGKALRTQKGYALIVVKSTVTPGTTERVVRPALEKYSAKKLGEYGLVANPEFLREGNAITDTLSPDRIVIGADDGRSGRKLKAFYERFYGSQLPRVLLTNTVNAELIKYASNAFLATKVSFINEIANLCNRVPGSDVSVVAKGMGLDKRIGPQFLEAGLGYGGSCFPKDVDALLALAGGLRARLSIVNAASEVNSEQPLEAVKLARKMLGSLEGKRIALLGLAFKPGTDDMREAVSTRLIREFLRNGSSVVAYDPAAIPNARRLFGRLVGYADSVKSCLLGSDCCIIVTEWNDFKVLGPDDFSVLKNQALVDGRKDLRPSQVREEGEVRCDWIRGAFR